MADSDGGLGALLDFREGIVRMEGGNSVRDAARGESGVALILVLGIVVLLSLLVLSALAISQSGGRLSKISRDRIAAAYQAEGGSDMAYWLLSEDIRSHRNRSLEVDYDLEAEERVMADGRLRSLGEMDGFSISYRIFDAASGLDVSGSYPEKKFSLYAQEASSRSDADTSEAAKAFIGALGDYVDSNALIRAVGGFERDNYAATGKSPLPRNGPMQYREEALWVPGCVRFTRVDEYGIVSSFRLISPRGLRGIRGKSNFFATAPDDLALWGKLSPDELDLVLEARRSWLSTGGRLGDSLPPGIIGKLRRSFSFNESGYYTVVVDVSGVTDGARRVFTNTLRIYSRLQSSRVLRYYDWRFLQ